MFVEAKRTSPSVLYVPHIGQWWDTVGPALRATFLSLLGSIPAFAPVLLLATCSLRQQHLSAEVRGDGSWGVVSPASLWSAPSGPAAVPGGAWGGFPSPSSHQWRKTKLL